MRSLDKNKTAVALLGGLALVGALAGCSAPAADTGTPSDSGSDTSDGATASGTYTDGTYTESADYQAPSGTETVDVTLTLADNVITDVQVTGHATDPEAKLHQGQFAGGIAGVVVGKNIDEIQVDKVGGSSLTSGGFNAAVDLIKADAAA
ncbi:MAG: FMN-binding protein [Rhodoglobus sp.]|nr:FMN-binding protein [Rhodoglobus sp.]